MARGIKTAKNNTYGSTQGSSSIQTDQAISPVQFTYPASTTTSATVYRGGTGGTPTGTTSLVIACQFADAAGYLHSDGYIVGQKGRKQFNVQSVSSGTASLTRATLTAVAPGSLTAGQMSINCVDPTGNQFYASRITDKFVWNTARFPYVLGTAAAVTYVDTTSSGGVTFTNSVGGTEGPFAIVTGV